VQEVQVVEEPAPKPKVITIPTAAMKRIKGEAATQALTARQQELDTDAQELGYDNDAAMRAALRAARQPAPAAPAASAQTQPAQAVQAAQPASASGNPELTALSARIQQLETSNATSLEDRKRTNRELAKKTRELARMQREKDELEVDRDLQLAAKEAGVIDTKYASSLFRESVKGMSEADLNAVDENKFFQTTLRQSHPHLYTPVERPVNTGNRSDPNARPPASAKPAGTADAEKPVDALKLDGQGFQSLLQSRGLVHPSTSGLPT
jgi:hypothetical protein